MRNPPSRRVWHLERPQPGRPVPDFETRLSWLGRRVQHPPLGARVSERGLPREPVRHGDPTRARGSSSPPGSSAPAGRCGSIPGSSRSKSPDRTRQPTCWGPPWRVLPIRTTVWVAQSDHPHWSRRAQPRGLARDAPRRSAARPSRPSNARRSEPVRCWQHLALPERRSRNHVWTTPAEVRGALSGSPVIQDNGGPRCEVVDAPIPAGTVQRAPLHKHEWR